MAAPNFIVIMTDQQRMDSLGCYGNVFTKTPHIDRLAAEGARFSAAFTPFPICTPSRATAWTGVMPHTHGIVDCCYNIDNAFDDSDVSTLLFDVLKKAGYDNAYFGKWHLGDGKPASVDHWDAFNSLGGHWIDGKQSFQDGVYKAAAQTERAISYLRGRRAGDPPFLLVQSYYPPHDPYAAPTEFYEPYRGKGVPFAGYYAAVSALDSYVGATMAALRETPFYDNTIVVFCSDHGETFLYRGGTDHKATCHDDSISIPLVFWGPGILNNAALQGMAGLQDIMPTLLDFAGAPLPKNNQGRSLRAELTTPGAPGRDLYYIQNTTDHRSEEELAKMFSVRFNGRAHSSPLRVEQRALRTRTHKLILSDDGKHSLFDLINDPEEELDLYAAPRQDAQNRYMHFPDQSGIVRALSLRLRDEARAVSDRFGEALADRVLTQG